MVHCEMCMVHISSEGLVPSDKLINFLGRLCKNFIYYAYPKCDLIFQVVPILCVALKLFSVIVDIIILWTENELNKDCWSSLHFNRAFPFPHDRPLKWHSYRSLYTASLIEYCQYGTTVEQLARSNDRTFSPAHINIVQLRILGSSFNINRIYD